MKVLVTGATGYLGRAVAQRLVSAGHAVTGLVRDDLSVRTLARTGIEPVLGDLGDPNSLRAAADGVDAVIEAVSADHAASTTALLEIIAGTGKRSIRTRTPPLLNEPAATNPGPEPSPHPAAAPAPRALPGRSGPLPTR